MEADEDNGEIFEPEADIPSGNSLENETLGSFLEDILKTITERDTPNDGKHTDNQFVKGTKCFGADIARMVLMIYLKHNLSWSALEDILTMLNLIFGENVVPINKYFFKKMFALQKPCFHFFCKKCFLYLGEKCEDKKDEECSNCKATTNISCKEKSFFIYLALRKQIENLLATHIDSITLNHAENNGTICDIFDGKLYERIKAENTSSEVTLTLSINTDGARVFKSKKHGSLWPLQCVLNEIPAKVRFNWENLILSGIWFGTDPDMTLYFKPLTEEIEDINDNPIVWKFGDQLLKIRVAPLIFPVDSVARCQIQMTTQYNGYYGCTFCLHPGNIFQ